MPTSESNAGNLIDLTEEVVHKGSRNITLDHMLRRSRHAVDLPQPPLMEQWVHDKKQKALAGLSNIPVPPGHAYFVLSHDRELEKGVIEAVHVEMLAFMKGQTDIFIQVQGPKIRPFLYIEAPNQDLITACLDEARAWADNIINDKTAKLDLVFVEPPTSDHSSFEIMRRGARPEMVPSVEDSSASDQLLFSHSVFEKSFVQQLTSGLKKAGRIKDKINLRVHIGRYVLTSVRRPPGLDQDDEQRFSFQEFSRIMRQSRARGRFLTYTGELAEALCVLRSIKNNDKVFLAGDMALATGEVEPEFYFDAESSKWRLEAHLHRRGEVMAANHELRSALEVAGVRAVEIVEGRENIQLDFKTLSLGQ